MKEQLTYLDYNNLSEVTITIDDIVNFYRKAATQTEYLGIYEDEYSFSFNSDNDLIVLAYTDKIVGIVTITRSTRRKNLHVGTLAIAIDIDYSGKGIGNTLMNKAIEWFRQNNGLSRLQLFVRTDNSKAILLYKKLGFYVEGELRNDTYMDGQYYNVYPMSLLKYS